MKQPVSGSRRHASGAGLIEVLVAVLVLAIGMLGIAAMQSAALRNSQSALERSQGVINSYTILDAMRANREAARSGDYNMAETCDPPGESEENLIQDDQHFWLDNLEKNLGEDTCGSIACAGNTCTITVKWDDTRGTGNFEDLTFTTEATL